MKRDALCNTLVLRFLRRYNDLERYRGLVSY